MIFVRRKREMPKPRGAAADSADAGKIVIVGGGAAGFAAAEMLRREGFAGGIAMLSDDDASPVDRPNLSKDYLAGSAPEDWMPLRPDELLARAGIDLRLNAEGRPRSTSEGAQRDARRRGQDPVRPAAAGDRRRAGPACRSRAPSCRMCASLRSLADCRAIIKRAGTARNACVVMGASFIGLEVAAALRARKLEVHVVAPEKRPMERVLGPADGRFRACAA